MTEENNSSTNYRTTPGTTSIASDVLLTVAHLTTLSVPGVSRMSTKTGRVNRLFKRGTGEGVEIDVQNDTVFVELHVILDKDVNIRDVSRNIQKKVSRAITEMVGMNIGKINVHVEDIDYPTEFEA